MKDGRQRYSNEFKREAVEKLLSGEYTLRKLSAELSVSVPTLLKWKRGSSAEPQSALADADRSEILRLRAELAKLMEERDRLRRGIAYLAGVTDLTVE